MPLSKSSNNLLKSLTYTEINIFFREELIMTRLVTYVAVLDDSENDKGVYTVSFPDVPGAITDGVGVAESRKNAEEVLGLMLFDWEQLPTPTDIEIIRENNPGTIVDYVVYDLDVAERESTTPQH